MKIIIITLLLLIGQANAKNTSANNTAENAWKGVISCVIIGCIYILANIVTCLVFRKRQKKIDNDKYFYERKYCYAKGLTPIGHDYCCGGTKCNILANNTPMIGCFCGDHAFPFSPYDHFLIFWVSVLAAIGIFQSTLHNMEMSEWAVKGITSVFGFVMTWISIAGLWIYNQVVFYNPKITFGCCFHIDDTNYPKCVTGFGYCVCKALGNLGNCSGGWDSKVANCCGGGLHMKQNLTRISSIITIADVVLILCCMIAVGLHYGKQQENEIQWVGVDIVVFGFFIPSVVLILTNVGHMFLFGSEVIGYEEIAEMEDFTEVWLKSVIRSERAYYAENDQAKTYENYSEVVQKVAANTKDPELGAIELKTGMEVEDADTSLESENEDATRPESENAGNHDEQQYSLVL